MRRFIVGMPHIIALRREVEKREAEVVAARDAYGLALGRYEAEIRVAIDAAQTEYDRICDEGGRTVEAAERAEQYLRSLAGHQ